MEVSHRQAGQETVVVVRRLEGVVMHEVVMHACVSSYCWLLTGRLIKVDEQQTIFILAHVQSTAVVSMCVDVR